MQQVDPFIPVSSAGPQPNPRSMAATQPALKAPQTKPFVHPRQSLASSQPMSPIRRQFEPLQSTKQPKAAAKQPTAPKPRNRVWSTLAQSVLLVAALTLGFMIRSPAVGQVAILIYAVLAFVCKIESRVTFIMALMAMGVVLLSSLRADSTLAGVFAIYAFLLLIIATLTLAREVREEI